MHVPQGALDEQHRPLNAVEPSADAQQRASSPQERRRQQRLLRQKRAKLLKRAAAQVQYEEGNQAAPGLSGRLPCWLAAAAADWRQQWRHFVSACFSHDSHLRP